MAASVFQLHLFAIVTRFSAWVQSFSSLPSNRPSALIPSFALFWSFSRTLSYTSIIMSTSSPTTATSISISLNYVKDVSYTITTDSIFKWNFLHLSLPAHHRSQAPFPFPHHLCPLLRVSSSASDFDIFSFSQFSLRAFFIFPFPIRFK